MIVYRGVSLIDRKTPIVVVLTGLGRGSGNGKTGAMVQAWILVDSRHPVDALRDGSDRAICGDCPHRGVRGKGRTCYVALHTGLHVVGRKVRDGLYPDLPIGAARRLLRGRRLRIGAYGDPAAVPIRVWRELTRETAGHTGYTHQWRRRPALRRYVMASVDSPRELHEARARGWRTFRVRRVGETLEPMQRGEIACPASQEAGKRTTCERCQLCNGATDGDKRRTIAIIDHSSQGRSALRRLQVLQ